MRCPGPGITVDLSLADANDAAATGSALQPTADSDAAGVQIELLRGGLPVQFGQRWGHGLSIGGNEDLDFTARYLRTGSDIAPGDIKGQAVLTADYR
ncbi:TPA: fimbrial protein [Stenotrophomonas maltophilia]|nr:fimbrial protein [Stenotrophomonas maltophilia]